MIVPEVDGPDACSGANVEDVMQDFIFGNRSCEELASKDELEFVVLKVKAIGFDFVIREGV